MSLDGDCGFGPSLVIGWKKRGGNKYLTDGAFSGAALSASIRALLSLYRVFPFVFRLGAGMLADALRRCFSAPLAFWGDLRPGKGLGD